MTAEHSRAEPVASPNVVDGALREEFRKGFYPDRPASWIEQVVNQSGQIQPDIAGCLVALADGKRDFSYPGHDPAVYRLLRRLIPRLGLKRGADIGCESGCFPAMQLAAGIEHCTVFEVRPAEANDRRVDVRLVDLTYSSDIEPEYDLVTCLSTIEHVGLGRYGDPIDPWGDLKMAENLRRLLRPGGVMLLSFPVGPGCVVYNMHRIYSPQRRAALFGDLKLIGRSAGGWRPGQIRLKLGVALRRQGAFSQPIYVLQKPA